MMADFPLIFGNDFHKNRIASAIRDSKLPHAMLLDGPSGSGKLTFAKEIAAALNCENSGRTADVLPCGSCNSCRRIISGSYTDVKVLERAKDKATIGVEEIRDFRSDMYLSPTESKYKIYIIDDAQKMTVMAQNALLIILEEPPKNVIIMLLASGTDSILTTVKSRVQYIPMSRFTTGELDEYLKKSNDEARRISVQDKESYEAALVSSDGVIGKALELLTPKKREENEQKRAEIFSILNAIKSRSSYTALYEALSALPTKRTDLMEDLELLITALGDLTVSKKTDDFVPLFFTSTEAAKNISGDISTFRLIKIYDIVRDTYGECIKNANTTLALTNMAVRIKMA